MQEQITLENLQETKEQNQQSIADKGQKRLDIKKRILLGKLKSKTIKTPDCVQVPKTASDLVVITKAKDLVAYIFIVTKSTPKKFRLTFITKLQNLGLEIIEYLYKANDIMVTKKDMSKYDKRREFQQNAMTNFKLLEYFAMLSFENECLTSKQYEQIAKQGSVCQILLANWIKSDSERLK